MVQQADVKQHALALLDLSKRFLREDGGLDPVAFLITADEQLLRPLELQDEAAKIKSCNEIVDEARRRHALAIITIFLARSKEFESEDFYEEAYSWGDLQELGADRCILVTISGPGVKNWAAALTFNEKGKEIIFEKIAEFADGVDLGLFPGWSDQISTPKVS
ncbi:MAG TPA: hypothetical protein VIW67_17260 [Terriglobales bacterium]|jgi:hypothetical protein